MRDDTTDPNPHDLGPPADREWPDPLADGDNDHYLVAVAEEDSAVPLIRSGLFLLRMMLETAPRPWGQVLSNDFAAIACFTRAYRQLRGATLLAHMGYYSEVPTVLRGAYEAGSVGRYLAKNPQKADKWLDKISWSPKGTAGWIPDREVRAWFGETDDRAYATMYRWLSKGTHPTAASSVTLLRLSEDGFSSRFASEFDPEAFSETLLQVLGVTLWLCFALQNAAANPELLPPDWRQALAEYAAKVGALTSERTGAPADYSHLQRDWEAEYDRHEKILDRILRGEEGQRVVAEHQAEFNRIVGQDLLRNDAPGPLSTEDSEE